MNNTNKTLRCSVRRSGEGYVGIIHIPGAKPTKLIKKDESCIYGNKSGLASAARAFAERYGMILEVEDTTITQV